VKSQITHISVVQTAKIVAVFSLVTSIPLLVLEAVPVIALPGPRPPFFGSYVLLMPLFYAVSSFMAVAVAAWLYNVLAKYIGGIEFTSVEIGRDAGRPAHPPTD
jgi:predicted transporter